MAKTMAHFVRCNVGTAEMHNSRNEQYIACVNASPKKHYNIFADETCNNSTWVNPEYTGKSLPQLLDGYRKLYREKVGQAPQEKDRVRQVVNKKTGMTEERTTPGWAPIREGIVPVTAKTTIKDFDNFKEWLKEKGIEIIRIDIHQDEGHIDPISGEHVYNRHAHIIASWIDPKTGRTRKLNKEDASMMQDEIAASLGMERGVKKELTGAEHLTHDQYRAKAQAEEVKKLQKEKAELEKQQRESFNRMQELGKETVTGFDRICEIGGFTATEAERDGRDSLERETTKEQPQNSEDTAAAVRTMHDLIQGTMKAISRIGAEIKRLAAIIPDGRFHLLASTAQKAQILAIEAEKEAEIGNIQTEADERVKQAENAKNEAIRQADAAKTKANKRSKDAMTQEEAAKDEKKKYEDLNTSLEQKIDEAKKEGKDAGYKDGYEDGKAAEQAKMQTKQTELDNLRTSHAKEITELNTSHTSEIGNLNKELSNVTFWREFFRKTNPYLANAEENWKELKGLKEWPLTDNEIIRIFSGEIVEKKYSEMRNYKKIELPVRIEIAESDQGNMRIWYNDTTKEECKKQLKQEVIRKGHGNGLSHS